MVQLIQKICFVTSSFNICLTPTLQLPATLVCLSQLFLLSKLPSKPSVLIQGRPCFFIPPSCLTMPALTLCPTALHIQYLSINFCELSLTSFFLSEGTVQFKYRVKLDYPDVATDDFNNKGFWTMIYNQVRAFSGFFYFLLVLVGPFLLAKPFLIMYICWRFIKLYH